MGLSIGYGVGVGLLYGLSSYLNFALAMRREGSRFMVVAFGGIIVRMTVAFALVLLGFLVLGVQGKPFFLAFMFTFALALIFEVSTLHRSARGITPSGSESDRTTNGQTDKTK